LALFFNVEIILRFDPKRFELKRWIVGLSLIAMALSGCGGGGGSAQDGGSGNPNNGNPASGPPKLLSFSPKDAVVSAFTPVTMTFDKPMDPNTFYKGLIFSPEAPSNDFTCAPGDCKTIFFRPGESFRFGETYALTLRSGADGVKDDTGLPLETSWTWSFTVGEFEADLDFVNLTVDGGGIPLEDEGECTTVAVDSLGTVHITYLSVAEASVKHAWCSADCNVLGSWQTELVDTGPSSAHGYGRDENMVIDQSNNLHVSYRDYGGLVDPNNLNGDGINILKYARKDAVSGLWQNVIVDDTEGGVTDTFIKVSNNGRIHITYHAKKGNNTGLYYATCDPNTDNCLATPSPWQVILVDKGVNFGQPNFLFVTESGGGAVHISYYAEGTLSYAFCPLSDLINDCIQEGFWVVVDKSAADVGTENSLFVDDRGVHITYRSIDSSDRQNLKYAFCQSPCLETSSWSTTTVDSERGAGSSTQLKIDGQGRIHVVYGDKLNGDLKYAFCADGCTTPGRWSLYRIDAPGDVGHDNYLALGPGPGGQGQTVYLSYRDHGNSALKFASGLAPSGP
jgi:hypothetical protein